MSEVLPPGVLEGQTVTRDLELSADVCIVGSGAGGAVAAATLQQAGLQVTLVEEGGYFTSPRFRMRDGEAYSQLYQESGARTTKDHAITVLQGRAVGGTTVINWTTCFRTPAEVLDHWRTHHAVGSITQGDLDPCWDVVEKRLSVAELPLVAANRNNRLLHDGCTKLGWSAESLRRNVLGCAQTGHCGHGCPIDAKQSMLVTYLPDAFAAGASLVSRARATRLEREGRTVTAVVGDLLDGPGRRPTGQRFRVRARHIVLAGGGIHTPTLLIASGVPDPHHRHGVRTFLHPTVGVMGLYDEPVHPYRGAPQSVASHHFAHRGDEVGFFLEAAPLQPLLAATAAPSHGDAHHDLITQLPNVTGHLALHLDGFHDDVPGGTVEVRPSGWPLLDYPIPDKMWRAVRESTKALARINLAAGARAVMTLHDPALRIQSEADVAKVDDLPFAPLRLPVFSAHVMGGAGMSDDPTRGVVRSEDLRHHHLDNLHVIDGSVFPTSLGVNPQLSIYGLSRLVAGRLAGAWKKPA